MTDDVGNVPISIRHYVDARFDDHGKQHAAEHRALDAAARATDARLESMNEWRASLNDAQAHYVSRELVDTLNTAMNERLTSTTASLHARVDDIARESQRGAILAGTAAGVIGVIGGFVLSHFVA